MCLLIFCLVFLLVNLDPRYHKQRQEHQIESDLISQELDYETDIQEGSGFLNNKYSIICTYRDILHPVLRENRCSHVLHELVEPDIESHVELLRSFVREPVVRAGTGPHKSPGEEAQGPE